MPDSFFSAPKQKKRKRTDSEPRHVVKKFARKPTAAKKSRKDEELSDQTDDDAGGVEDMDLRADDMDPGASGDEDENETPAEKRLRLAQLYLESVKVGLGKFQYHFCFVPFLHLFQPKENSTLQKSTRSSSRLD